jgi:hypothetical protein
VNTWTGRWVKDPSDSYQPRLKIPDQPDRRIISVEGEWFPLRLIEPFARDVGSEWPSIERLEVGFDFDVPLRDDDAFIAVPKKQIRLEDDRRVTVESFRIAQYPVSIAQVSRFVAETGYVTVAEQRHDEFHFRHHPGISIVPREKRTQLPAEWVCYLDAIAYCKWARVRLPTEEEWVAAAVLDETIYADREQEIRRYDELSESPMALKQKSSREITSTLADSSHVILREGPGYIWRSDRSVWRYFRSTASVRHYASVGFRVCKIG